MIKDIHYAGYSTEPSDYECPDGQLATSLNLINEDGHLKPVFQPAEKFALTDGEQLLCIHKITGRTHYIILLNNNALYWLCEEDEDPDAPTDEWTRNEIAGLTIDGTPTVGSIGNTLIVNDSNGINYLLWTTDGNQHTYVALGQKPPMLDIQFGLHTDFAVWPNKPNTKDKNNFAKIDVGKMNNALLPDLATSGAAAYARPKPVMAADTTTDDNGRAYFVEFANNYATYSVENVNANNEQQNSDLAIIKNRLSQGVFAYINSFINIKGTKENKFVFPFFVRYAYRLYDDTYIMHSYPVLMIPNSRGPVFALDGKQGLFLADYTDNKIGFYMQGRVYGFLAKLVYSVLSTPDTINRLSKWKDIITSVAIGVSPPVWTLEQAGQVFGWTNMDDQGAWDEYYSISKVTEMTGAENYRGVPAPGWGINGISRFKDVFETLEGAAQNTNNGGFYDFGDFFNRYDSNYRYPSYIATVPQRNDKDIKNDLAAASNFHIIKEIALDDIDSTPELELELDKGTLASLRSRRRITDDYRSHDSLNASLMYNYNGRMNLAGVTRTPHAPLSPATQVPMTDDNNASTLQIAVSLKNDTQQMITAASTGHTQLAFPLWLYYPDTAAKEAYVSIGNTCRRISLTQHDFLNGAYWLGDIFDPPSAGTLPGSSIDALPTASVTVIPEPNKLYTSNVNNPFVFEPENIKSIGTGRIMAICSAAKALSQGQFGQFPLYAFTDEGVWALEVSPTGTFTARQPFTRDVCNNAQAITQIDTSVLFPTARGIMLISGSETQCITDGIGAEQPFNVLDLPAMALLHSKLGHGDDGCLPTRAFSNFLEGCRMIYDYAHQRIIIFNTAFSYAYVYSLKSRMWGMMYANFDYTVNAYPDAMAVTKDNKLVSFRTTDETISKGLFVTRPLKLEAPDIHKTVSALIQRGHFQRGDVETVLYGSRDLYNWRLVWSSRDHYLRGFSGTPYKYFRIAGLTTLTDGKSLFGASVEFKQRLTNNLR